MHPAGSETRAERGTLPRMLVPRVRPSPPRNTFSRRFAASRRRLPQESMAIASQCNGRLRRRDGNRSSRLPRASEDFGLRLNVG
jgi:hypothetical protein